MSAAIAPAPAFPATYAQRVAFVSEIAARLHRYGTTAQRLESAVVALSQQLVLDCEPWSNPTGLILSFSDPTKAIGLSNVTQQLRLLFPQDASIRLKAFAGKGFEVEIVMPNIKISDLSQTGE